MNKFQKRLTKYTKERLKLYEDSTFKKEKRALLRNHKYIVSMLGVSTLSVNIKDKRNRNIVNKKAQIYLNYNK